MNLGKYSFGTGDRFGRQGKAQLAAIIRARAEGVEISPVWNKSHREHSIIGTRPADVRTEADNAVRVCGWDGAYLVDADHIGLNTVDQFIKSSDFFTIDVADFIARRASEGDINSFVRKQSKYIGKLSIDGTDATFNITEKQIRAAAEKFLLAVKRAGQIYRHIEAAKGAGNFVTEISMDETDRPQTPAELFFILAAVADEGVPAQTIAPKFVGRFNKGVDYEGSVARFARQFQEDLAVIAFAIREFALPQNLKLSIHSGSDKFSIYGSIRAALKKFDAGIHIKTAGTTWLEELVGLAMAGGEGLAIAKEIYAKAFLRIDELCGPYATVIDIDRARLPSPQEVEKWDEERFAATLRHPAPIGRSIKDVHKSNRKIDLGRSIGAGQAYNLNFRQLLHVGYKVAAEMGHSYLDALEKYKDIIAQNVTENIYQRHIRPIFIG
jgi:hypothetical protein